MAEHINVEVTDNKTGNVSRIEYVADHDGWEGMIADEKNVLIGNHILTLKEFEGGDFTFKY